MLKLSSESIHGAQWVVVRPPWHLLCWVSSRELRLPRQASALYARVVGVSGEPTECSLFWARHWEQWEERIKQEQSLWSCCAQGPEEDLLSQQRLWSWGSLFPFGNMGDSPI